MEHFAHSFILTLIHSVWQALLLICAYYSFVKLIKHNHPAAKRNAAFIFLTLQLATSIFTFVFYYYREEINLPIILGTWDVKSPYNFLHSFSGYLLIFYFAMIGYKIFSLVFQWQKFNRLNAKLCLKPDVDISFFTHAMAKRMGIKRKVKVWLSGHISSPLTYGFLKPVILLPVSLMNHLTTEETETLIIHELAHIRQNDFLLNWFLLITETVYFFNPFIKILANEARKQRELSCDIEVMEKEYSALQYANTLYKTAQAHLATPVFSIAAAQNVNALLHRILFFSNTDNHFLPKRKLMFAPLLSVALIAMILLSIIPFKNSPLKTAASTKPVLPAQSTNFHPIEIKKSQPAVATLPNLTVYSNKAINKIKENKKAASIKPNESLASVNIQPDYNIVPVNYYAAPDSVHEIIVSEENSNGNSITKSYKLSYKNGKWVFNLLWIVENKKAEGDSMPSIIQHY